MNNLQFIIKDNSRYAMHVAVELCEQGDFDSVIEAFKWLMQERDDIELDSSTCELIETDSYSNANEVVHVLECSACGETCEHVNGSYPRCPHCGRKVVIA